MGALMLLIATSVWGVLATASKGPGTNGQRCPEPTKIEHGHMENRSMENEQGEHIVHYHCDPYYRLRGPGNGLYQCNEMGLWVNHDAGAEPPVCEPVCGKPKNPPRQLQRIIGGHLSGKGLFPWQGRLVLPRNLVAGATLISDRWVLTTARNVYLGQKACVSPEDIAPTLQLFLGSKGQLPTGTVERVVLHPSFNSTDCNSTCGSTSTSITDLALLKLQHPVPLGPEVLPICLAHKDFLEVGRVGYVAGWGRGTTLAFAERLRYIMLPVVDTSLCAEYYAGGSPLGVAPDLGPGTFCVGMSELRGDTCHGDAGGAFAVHDPDDDTWYAAGILTYDRTCSAAKFSFYASVQHALAWIRRTMAES
ncbi:PREDICTED: haptoglobin-like isoform X1 [Crocodylus porosus]|nr:PREDICTED: haptoglobin-like isoform X1 [Crocodylus porosus]